ncbi:MAG: DNA gyrase subunit A, partial [Synechococcaceae bacterium WB6_3A_227]|nr:DNA gyrase subunit A [Synechococcaceae bacterium WB6_3A_227]
PTVMPARLPHLLLNGSSGIAVGMATNIPPHNLGELIDGVLALIANPELDDRSLMSIIPGPDFPTGGQILGRQGIRETYSGGRGSITMRGVAAIETLEVKGRPDRDAVIITELPYQTNKAALIERIAELVNDKKLEGISDIRDESDRDGMRIVIELRRDAYPQVVLNNLYKITPLQNNFSAYMLALVKGEPLVLNLRRMLQVFIEFRIETIERRTRYLLRKAEERDHILLGLLVALNDLDAIIKLIRGAADAATARQELTAQHGLTDIQADAILQMQLRRLTALEADKIRLEHEDLLAKIANYKNILENRERVLEIIEAELKQLKEKHSTPRRTEILDLEGGLEDIDLIANELAVSAFEEEVQLLMLTSGGYIKRTLLSAFSNIRANGLIAIGLEPSDALRWVRLAKVGDSVLIGSLKGMAIHFRISDDELRPLGRSARGVRAMALRAGDSLMSMDVLPKDLADRIANSNLEIADAAADADADVDVPTTSEGPWVLVATASGLGKRVPVDQFRLQKRAGMGLRGIKFRRDGDTLVGLRVMGEEEELLLVSE